MGIPKNEANPWIEKRIPNAFSIRFFPEKWDKQTTLSVITPPVKKPKIKAYKLNIEADL